MRRVLAAACALLATGAAEEASAPEANTRVGVISYWGKEPAAYRSIPAGGLALINPDNGVLVSAGQTMQPVGSHPEWRRVTRRMRDRSVEVQGYVPTGYFRHDCNEHGKCQSWARIEAQVGVYFAAIPELSGIFFDETAADKPCDVWRAEYAKLRAIVRRYSPKATITFNAGTPSACLAPAAERGEVVVLFEHDLTSFRKQETEIAAAIAAARARGVRSWILAHSVRDVAEMRSFIAWGQKQGIDHIYATDIGGNWQAGDQTWNRPPSYWGEQLRLLKAPD